MASSPSQTMKSSDVEFLAQALRCSVGVVTVNIDDLALESGLTKGSIKNKFTKFKKDYKLDLASTSAGTANKNMPRKRKTESDDDGPLSPCETPPSKRPKTPKSIEYGRATQPGKSSDVAPNRDSANASKLAAYSP